MRILPLVFLFLSELLLVHPTNGQKAIHKILSKNGDIDKVEIQRLTEHLKSILALYSAMGGTNCDGDSCELTTALGLGEQGSEAHKALIEKYFPEDKVAQALIKQNCYLRPAGASTFSGYDYLTLSISRDTVKVYYQLDFYDHGRVEKTQGPDVYLFRNGKYRMLTRHIWTQYDK